MDKKILDIRSLKKYYGKGENLTRAVDGISFYVLPGEFVGIMGPSGSGKTTLLNCIASIVRPTEGEIYLEGVNIAAFNEKQQMEYRGKKMGYLFQDFKLLDNLTGRENILMPAAIHGMKKQESERQIRRHKDILPSGKIVQQLKVLEQISHLLPAVLHLLLFIESGSIDPFQTDLSLCGTYDRGDAVQKRSLAAAGRTHDPYKLSRQDIEGNPVHRLCDVLTSSVIFFQ